MKKISILVAAAGLLGGCGGSNLDQLSTGYVIDSPVDLGPVDVTASGAQPSGVAVDAVQFVPVGSYSATIPEGTLDFQVTEGVITTIQLSAIVFDAPAGTSADGRLRWSAPGETAQLQDSGTSAYAFPEEVTFSASSDGSVLAERKLDPYLPLHFEVGAIQVAGTTRYDVWDASGTARLRSDLSPGEVYWLLPRTYELRATGTSTVLASGVVVEATQVTSVP